MAQQEVALKEERNKRAEGIARLLRETQEGSLHWRFVFTPENLDVEPDDRVQQVYEAQREGWLLRLYKRSYEVVPSVHDTFFAGIILRDRQVRGRQDRHWESEVVLEVLGPNGVSSQPFRGMGALRDLLTAAKSKLSQSEQFVDNLMESTSGQGSS